LSFDLGGLDDGIREGCGEERQDIRSCASLEGNETIVNVGRLRRQFVARFWAFWTRVFQTRNMHGGRKQVLRDWTAVGLCWDASKFNDYCGFDD